MFLPPPPSFGSKRYIIAPKADQMSLKWESFVDESFKFKYGYNIKVLETHTAY
jgi:hypothetical protein